MGQVIEMFCDLYLCGRCICSVCVHFGFSAPECSTQQSCVTHGNPHRPSIVFLVLAVVKMEQAQLANRVAWVRCSGNGTSATFIVDLRGHT